MPRRDRQVIDSLKRIAVPTVLVDAALAAAVREFLEEI
jgi:hypothetical protein